MKKLGVKIRHSMCYLAGFGLLVGFWFLFQLKVFTAFYIWIGSSIVGLIFSDDLNE